MDFENVNEYGGEASIDYQGNDKDITLKIILLQQIRRILRIASQELRGGYYLEQTDLRGNTKEFYAVEGTLAKSTMLANLHPDVAKVVWRFNRWHHHVDYKPFRENKLIRRDDAEIPTGTNDYGMRLVKLGAGGPTPTTALT